MRRAFFGLALTVLALDPAKPVSAEWGKDFFAGVRRDFQRNNSWPDVFVNADRQSVHNTVMLATNAGWQHQNTMHSHHFDSNQRLTLSGETKVRAILLKSPAQRRTLWVQQGESAEITAARIETVQQAATRYSTTGQLPEVLEVNTIVDGWPADEVDAIYTKFRSSQPEPRMKEKTIGGSTQ